MAVVSRPKVTVSADTETIVKNLEVTVTASTDAESYYSTDQVTWVKIEDTLYLTENGVYYFKAVNPVNGLESSSYTELTVSNIDNVAPDLQVDFSTRSWTNEDVIITATASEGVVEYLADGEWVAGNSLTVAENGTYQFRVADALGNVNIQEVEVDWIDKIAPTLEITGNAEEWISHDITLVAQSDGIVEYFSDGEWVEGKSLTVSENGTYQFRATDLAGNVTLREVVVDKIDKTAPALEISGVLVGDTVEITAVTDEGTVEYSVNDEWVAGDKLAVSESGVYEFRVVDNSGNITEKRVTVIKDSFPSSGSSTMQIYSGNTLIVYPGCTVLPSVRVLPEATATIYGGVVFHQFNAQAGAEINGFTLTRTCASSFSSLMQSSNPGYLLTLSEVSVNDGNTGIVYAGQRVSSVQVNEGGHIIVNEDGYVYKATVAVGGSITLYDGALFNGQVAAGAKINGFLLSSSFSRGSSFYTPLSISNVTVCTGDTGTVYAGQKVTGVEVQEGASLVLGKDAVANDITVAQGGSLVVGNGSFANGITVEEGSRLTVEEGANIFVETTAGVIVNGFTMKGEGIVDGYDLDIRDAVVNAGDTGTVYAGQTVSDIQVAEGGSFVLRKGGTASNVTVANGCSIIVEEGAAFNSLDVYANSVVNGFVLRSTQTFYDNTLSINAATINSGATGTVYDGQVVSSIRFADQDGHLVVCNGGLAKVSSIAPYCSLTVEAGGMVTAVNESNPVNVSGKGAITIHGGALFSALQINYGAKVNGFRLKSTVTVAENILSIGNVTVKSGDTGTVYAGQIFTSVQVANGGSLIICKDGTANGVTITSGSSVTIEEGALFDQLDIAAGAKVNGFSVSNSCTLNTNTLNITNVVIESGETGTVYANQTVTGIRVEDGGSLVLCKGGTASNITVYQGGSITVEEGAAFTQLNVAAGATINGITLESSAVFTDNILNFGSFTVNSGSNVTMGQGQNASLITVEANGQLLLNDYSNINKATVNGGSITIYNGAQFETIEAAALSEINGFTVSGTVSLSSSVVSIAGAIVVAGDTGTVYAGQTVSEVKVGLGGQMIVYDGGTANSVVVANGGSVTIHAGAQFDNISLREQYAEINGFRVRSSGASLSNSVVSLANAELYAGDTGTVYEGQTVNYVHIYRGGTMYVYAGGSVSDVIMDAGANMTVYADGVITGSLQVNAGSKINGFSFEHGNSYSVDGELVVSGATVKSGDTGTVYEGQTVREVGVADGGNMYVYAGGKITSATVGAGGSVTVSDNASFERLIVYANAKFNGFSLNTTDPLTSATFRNNTFRGVKVDSGDTGTVYAGQTVTSATLNEGGNMVIREGGIAERINLHGGTLLVQGTLDFTKGGELYISVSNSAANTVTIDGGKIALSLTSSAAPLRLDVIEGITNETISVTVDNAGIGEYTIANAYSGAFDTITVINEGIALGQLSVNGDSISVNGFSYSLVNTDSTLNVVVTDILPPAAPVISGVSTTNLTNEDVIISLSFAEDSVLNEYSLDGNTWFSFAGAGTFTATDNGIYYFRSTDSAGLTSEVTSYTVSNIDKIAPTLEITGNAAEWTNQNVTLHATASDGTVEYFNGSEWVAGDTLTVSENGTYKFRVTDAAGNVTTQDVVVGKIDKVAPDKPAAYADITAITNQDVTVYATFSDDSAKKEYSLDGILWVAYTTGIRFEQNGIIYFRGTDEAGNESDITVWEVKNIDKSATDKPFAWADINLPTNGQVTVTAEFSDDTVIKEYSLDGKNWIEYTRPVVFDDNGKVYFRGTDDAGNVSEVTIFEVGNIDKVAPTLEISGNADDWTYLDITLRATASDGTVEYFNGTEWVKGDTFTVGENGIYQFRATDTAGNITVKDVVVDKIDKVIVPQNLQVTADGLSWQGTRYAISYQLELGKDSAGTIRLETAGTAVDFYSSAENTFSWQVAADNGEWITGADIVINSKAAQKYTSTENGSLDLFIVSVSGIWDNECVAQHLGVIDGWTGTNEFVVLDGKNILADIFEGSNDANILLMTDDANGDALFVDDIYTALPGTVTEQQARIAHIDEIRAGAGDDIVDMTSQQFAYIGDGVKIYGGSGDDVIWANNGANRLFGDSGSDRIVGGSGNDVIAGGADNDSLHGGGGADTFCFGENWGCDTIEQLADGEVVLWFESGSMDNWNADTFTYTDGTNTVTVTGVAAGKITLKFGDDDSARYDELAESGCFEDAVSEKIFEDKSKGYLA